MHIRSRAVRLLAAAALMAGALTAMISAPATAAATAAQVSCYGQAVYYTTHWGPEWAEWPPAGIWAVTGPYCADINVRPNSTTYVRTCFRKTGTCNAWHWIFGGTWGTAATDVLDGTQFYLQFDRGSAGLVAY
jgi:hypothetical protein